MGYPRITPTEVSGAPRLLDVDAAASVLGMGTVSVRRLIAKGKLGCVRLGKTTLRVHTDDLAAYIATCRTPAKGKARG